MTNNRIVELPSTIGNLKNLSMLFISDNMIVKLPSTLNDLINLNLFAYRYNEIKEIPSYLYRWYDQLKDTDTIYKTRQPCHNYNISKTYEDTIKRITSSKITITYKEIIDDLTQLKYTSLIKIIDSLHKNHMI